MIAKTSVSALTLSAGMRFPSRSIVSCDWWNGTGTPVDPDRFVADLAAALTVLISDPARADAMGVAGRRRAVEHFSWSRIAVDTLEVYRSVL